MRLAKLAVALAAFGLATPSVAQTTGVADVVATASDCLQLANKDGVPTGLLLKAGWVLGSDGLYRHVDRVPTIGLPADKDGVSRICVVEAPSLDRKSREQLSRELSKLLKSKPLKQSNSEIWMVSLRGTRGIQLFEADAAGQPAIRIIAAQF